jgi:uncharacterized membrane protein YccC
MTYSDGVNSGSPPASSRRRMWEQTADAVLDDYGNARVDGLRTALALLAIFAVIALFFTRRVPDEQPVGAATTQASGSG